MSEQGGPGWTPQQPPSPYAPPPPNAPPSPYAPQQYPPQGWQQAGGYGYPQPRDTNGFAIASLVCSLVGVFILVIGPLLGVIFGVVALKQIPRLGQTGRGLAIAGLIIGGIILLLDVVGLIAIATDSTTNGSVGVNV